LFEAVIEVFTEELTDEKGYRYNNYVVEFPNGSRINCMSSNPRRFRSKGGDVCLDEFDWHDSPGDMLDAASPVTTWGYDLVILTTRNGEGSEFDKLVEKTKKVVSGRATAKELRTLSWNYHFTPITIAVEQGLAEKIRKLDRVNQNVREDFIEECRARCRNEDAFNQEYMCIPSATASTLIPYDLYQSCEDARCQQELVSKEPKEYYLGGDIGREKHLTVFWIDEKLGDVFICRKIVRLQKTPYNVQLTLLSDLLSNRNIKRACIDATGIGDMLVEQAQRIFGEYRVEKVKFTSTVKEHLASQQLGLLQDKRCRVPDDRHVRESFHSVKKTVTVAGNIRFDAVATDELGHADDFWASALAKEAGKINEASECILL